MNLFQNLFALGAQQAYRECDRRFQDIKAAVKAQDGIASILWDAVKWASLT